MQITDLILHLRTTTFTKEKRFILVNYAVNINVLIWIYIKKAKIVIPIDGLNLLSDHLQHLQGHWSLV